MNRVFMRKLKIYTWLLNLGKHTAFTHNNGKANYS